MREEMNEILKLNDELAESLRVNSLQGLHLSGYVRQSMCKHEYAATEDTKQTGEVTCANCHKTVKCPHTLAEFEIDNNGGTVAQCSICLKDITEFLPEPVSCDECGRPATTKYAFSDPYEAGAGEGHYYSTDRCDLHPEPDPQYIAEPL